VSALNEVVAKARASGAPLADRLRLVADTVRDAAPIFADAVDVFVDRLVTTEAGKAAPGLGEVLPNFILPDQDSRLVTLRSLLADGPVMIAFLRGHWCPYCQTTAAALAEIAGAVSGAGARLIAITPDKRRYNARIREATENAYAILSDIDNGYALSLNLAIWVDEAMADLIAKAGNDIPTYQGGASWLLPIPAMFVLDRSGAIVARHVNADYRERADLDKMLAALRALA
jgi:peroxiredoxin